MERADRGMLRETRRLFGDLSGLGSAKAPSSLLPSVLARVGLADAYAPLDTPVGNVYVAYNERGISAVMRAEDATAFEEYFRERFGRPARRMPALPADLAHTVERRLSGERRANPRFDLRGLSEFELAVLRKALEIPRGEVRPYAWVAREIGRPGAVRAVGSALGRNPIPLLIPCHRVVRSDGRMGDYALGPETKRVALAAEGVRPDELERLARAGIRFIGSETTGVYCYPTCHDARRIAEPHRVAFRSHQDAALAGYRPCKDCRPAAAS